MLAWDPVERPTAAELLHQPYVNPLAARYCASAAPLLLLQAIDLADLLQPMLAWDPAARPTAVELLQHPYFKPLNNNQKLSKS